LVGSEFYFFPFYYATAYVKPSYGFRLTNNVLSTAQQVYLRKLGGAKPNMDENASKIISAGRAKRSIAQPDDAGER